MAFSEKISLIVDVVTGQSTSSISKLRTELAATDGAFNKMKVAGGGAFDFLKQNAGVAMLGIGTAVGAAGAQMVSTFQDTALGAGELRDSLGLTAEEASRFQEVAGDLGIGVEAVETSLGRMNRAAASTPQHFAAIGAEIARNADGTTNVQQTFLNVVEALNRIPDATQRAAAAQQIFGRGWQSMAEMIEMGADGVKTALASVEEGKIINDAEIDKARQFRDSLDELKGAGEELATAIGGEIVPALSGFMDVASTIIETVKTVKGAVDGMFAAVPGGEAYGDLVFGGPLAAGQMALDKLSGAYDYFTNKVSGSVNPALSEQLALLEQGGAGMLEMADASAVAFDSLGPLAPLVDRAGESFERLAAENQANAEAAQAAADALSGEADALRDVAAAGRESADAGLAAMRAQQDWQATIDGWGAAVEGAADDQQALNDVVNSGVDSAINYADATVAAFDAQATANGAAMDGAGKVALFNQKMVEAAGTAQGPLRDGILAYVEQANQIPPEKVTEFRALVQMGDIAGAIALLNEASMTREALIQATVVDANAKYQLDAAAAPREAFINAVGVTGIAEGGLNTTARPRNAPITGVGSFTNVEGQANTTARQRTTTFVSTANMSTAESAAINASRARTTPFSANPNMSSAESAANNAARARNIPFSGTFTGLSGVPSSVTIPVNLSVRSSNLGSFGAVALSDGGTVPGSGNQDTVPAMLTPGEFVVTKNAAKRLGVDALHRINAGLVQRFADGGWVRPARSGEKDSRNWDVGFDSNGRRMARRPLPGAQWMDFEDGSSGWRGGRQSGRRQGRPMFRNWAEREAYYGRGGGNNITINTQSDRPREIANVMAARLWRERMATRTASRR